MSADQPKPRFEPPPWEQEAFERFQKAREQERAREELNAALLAVREEPEKPATTDQPLPSPASTQAVEPPEAGKDERPAAATGVSEAQIDSMLIQLRGEEPPVKETNKALVYTVVAFMGVSGVFIVVQSAVLFGDARASGAASNLLAATVSFMVFVTGLAFLGGAFLLFRKYNQ